MKVLLGVIVICFLNVFFIISIRRLNRFLAVFTPLTNGEEWFKRSVYLRCSCVVVLQSLIAKTMPPFVWISIELMIHCKFLSIHFGKLLDTRIDLFGVQIFAPNPKDERLLHLLYPFC